MWASWWATNSARRAVAWGSAEDASQAHDQWQDKQNDEWITGYGERLDKVSQGHEHDSSIDDARWQDEWINGYGEGLERRSRTAAVRWKDTTWWPGCEEARADKPYEIHPHITGRARRAASPQRSEDCLSVASSGVR